MKMKHHFKKWILCLTCMIILIFGITACDRKSEIFISVENMENYTITEYPTGTVNTSHTDDGISVTVKKDGDYVFVLEDADGNNYNITLTYKDKTATVEADEHLTVKTNVR